MSILRKSTSQRPMLRWALVAMCVVSGAALHTGVVQAHEYKFGTLVIDHPWTRETPEGAKVAAGFVTITNNGAIRRQSWLACLRKLHLVRKSTKWR